MSRIELAHRYPLYQNIRAVASKSATVNAPNACLFIKSLRSSLDKEVSVDSNYRALSVLRGAWVEFAGVRLVRPGLFRGGVPLWIENVVATRVVVASIEPADGVVVPGESFRGGDIHVGDPCDVVARLVE